MSANTLGWICSGLAGLCIGITEFATGQPTWVSLVMLGIFGFGLVAGMCTEYTEHQKRLRKGRHR